MTTLRSFTISAFLIFTSGAAFSNFNLAGLWHEHAVLESDNPFDSTLINRYQQLASQYFDKDRSDSAAFFIDRIEKMYSETQSWKPLYQFYDQLAKDFWDKGAYENALTYHTEALQLCQNKIPNDYSTLGDAYLNAGISNYFCGHLDVAIDHYQSALELLQKHAKSSDARIGRLYNNIGIIYQEKGYSEEAIPYYEQSLAFWIKQYGALHPNVAAIYNNLGVLYENNGDYQEGHEYYQKALDIKLKTLDPDHPDIALALNNLGANAQVSGDNDKALKYYLRALAIRSKVLDPNHPDIAFNYNNLGIVYTEKGDYQKALDYHNKALSIWKKSLGENHPSVANSYDHIGIVYTKMKQDEKALGFYQKALQIRENRHEQYSKDLAITHENIGTALVNLQHFHEALEEYQKAIMALVPNFNPDNSYDNPEIDKVFSKPELLAVLEMKGDALQKLDTPEDLNASLQSYLLATNLIVSIRTEFVTMKSKLALGNKGEGLVDHAIEVAVKLYNQSGDHVYLATVFQMMEKNKANLLQETLADKRAKSFVHMPDSVLEKERRIKTDLAYYNSELNWVYRHATDDTAALKNCQDSVFSLRRQNQALIQEMEDQFPDYYQLKYQFTDLDVRTFQQHLQPDEALIEYFIGENTIHTILLLNNKIEYVNIPKPKQLDRDIDKFQASLARKDLAQYMKTGSDLYQTVLAPVIKRIKAIQDQTDQLIIIPDGALSYLPFETLLQNTPASGNGYKDLPYLIKNYNIIYHYSAKLMTWNIAEREKFPSGDFVGFAPTFRDNDGKQLLTYQRAQGAEVDSLPDLPFAEDEVRSIAAILNGDANTGSSVSEAMFKNAASGHSIIHLASHSRVDDVDPMNSEIIFNTSEEDEEDGLLHTYELFNLSLSADLVCLSACNTGTGNYYKGEGIMSLARGFSYAGVPNIMMSLWPVSDKPTMDIMLLFYQALDKGMPYAKAMREAKLKYLEQADNITANPYYWGAFIYLGTPTASLTTDRNRLFWAVTAIIVAIMIFTAGFFIWRKKRSVLQG